MGEDNGTKQDMLPSQVFVLLKDQERKGNRKLHLIIFNIGLLSLFCLSLTHTHTITYKIRINKTLLTSATII